MFIERLLPDQRPELIAPEPRPCSCSEYDDGVSALHDFKPAHSFEYAPSDGSRLIGYGMAVRYFCPGVNISDLQIFRDTDSLLEHTADDSAHLSIYRFPACQGNDLSRLHIVSYFDSGLYLS